MEDGTLLNVTERSIDATNTTGELLGNGGAVDASTNASASFPVNNGNAVVDKLQTTFKSLITEAITHIPTEGASVSNETSDNTASGIYAGAVTTEEPYQGVNKALWIWVPYFVLTIVMITLLGLSYVKFHKKNKHKYFHKYQHGERKVRAGSAGSIQANHKRLLQPMPIKLPHGAEIDPPPVASPVGSHSLNGHDVKENAKPPARTGSLEFVKNEEMKVKAFANNAYVADNANEKRKGSDKVRRYRSVELALDRFDRPSWGEHEIPRGSFYGNPRKQALREEMHRN